MSRSRAVSAVVHRGKMQARQCRCIPAHCTLNLLMHVAILVLCSQLLIPHATAMEGDEGISSSGGSSGEGLHETAATADMQGPNVQNSELVQTVLLLIKLRPSRSRSKADVVSAIKPWKAADWGPSGAWELNVVDNDALVLSSSSMPDAVKAKDWLLQQEMVYEVEFSGEEGQVFRRPGDEPIEDLRRRLSKKVQEERRQRGWQWLMRAARQQGVKLRRPKHRRPGRGRGQGQLSGKQEL